MFVNNEDLNQIIEIDPNGLKVRSRWPIAPCKERSGMAIDVAHKRLFSGCHNGITTAVDYSTSKGRRYISNRSRRRFKPVRPWHFFSFRVL